MAADQYTISDLGVGGPTGINNNGDVVGVSGFGAYGTRACIFRGTNVIDLGVLGGALGSNYSQATAINDNGDVVGYSTITNNVIHAFLYTAGVMKDLGTLDGGSNLESALSPLTPWVRLSAILTLQPVRSGHFCIPMES